MASDSQLLEGNKVKIGKQIVLPLSKAVEISMRGLKVRFWRSLITMSGIILAIAFMVSIGSGSAVLKGLWTGRISGRPVKKMEVIVDIRRETSTLSYLPPDAPEGSADMKEVEVSRERAIRNTVAWVLRRKGLEDPAEVAAMGGNQQAPEPVEPGKPGAGAQVSAGTGGGGGSRDAWLVALSLCVAVVGIVNSMLMSVTERFREIGTMKCLGALDSFVIKLFLLESTFVGFIGTIIGVLIGLLLTMGSSLVSYWSLRSLIFVALPWEEVLWGVLVAVVSGTVLSVIGAIYPAIVAARMEPVAALRQNA
jgi:ABC-type antimicrobial peptide transport system permease subunit